FPLAASHRDDLSPLRHPQEGAHSDYVVEEIDQIFPLPPHHIHRHGASVEAEVAVLFSFPKEIVKQGNVFAEHFRSDGSGLKRSLFHVFLQEGFQGIHGDKQADAHPGHRRHGAHQRSGVQPLQILGQKDDGQSCACCWFTDHPPCAFCACCASI